jgi:toxin ParE1/3/4
LADGIDPAAKRRAELDAKTNTFLAVADEWLLTKKASLTESNWDDVQADKYLDELNAAIDSLARNPHLGVRRDNVREGYRALFVNRHAVYYRLSATSVDVVRVLHGQMDLYN